LGRRGRLKRPDKGAALEWRLIRESAGLYAGGLVFTILSGQEGWELWRQSRLAVTCLVSTRFDWQAMLWPGDWLPGGQGE
jgi:hypothetical protein